MQLAKIFFSIFVLDLKSAIHLFTFVKTFLDLHHRLCDKEKCINMKIHCQETRHCSCLSVNCTTYCTILRHKVDDLGFRTYEQPNMYVQCHLDLVTLNLVTTCDFLTILQRPFFNLLNKIIQFSDIMRFSDSFCGDQMCH